VPLQQRAGDQDQEIARTICAPKERAPSAAGAARGLTLWMVLGYERLGSSSLVLPA